MAIARLELEDKYLDLTVRELLIQLEENTPQKNMSYIVHLSRFGVSLTKGQESNHYHTQEQLILERGDEVFEKIAKTKEEEKADLPYVELTEIQKERKLKVLGKLKLSEAQLEALRLAEFRPYPHDLNRGYCYGLSTYDRSETVLLRNKIGFSPSVCESEKLMNPLAYMSDEAFDLWENGEELVVGRLQK